MSLSLEHFKIIVDSVFEKRFAALKGNPTKNVVVELVCGKDDGIERATSEVIEAYFDELQPFGDCTKCEIPTTKTCELCFAASDAKRDFMLSKMATKGGRHAWAMYEGKKWHELLSLVNRYSRRKGSPRKKRCAILKELWLQHKPHLRNTVADTEGLQNLDIHIFI